LASARTLTHSPFIPARTVVQVSTTYRSAKAHATIHADELDCFRRLAPRRDGGLPRDAYGLPMAIRA
jgi:hypothetical protein